MTTPHPVTPPVPDEVIKDIQQAVTVAESDVKAVKKEADKVAKTNVFKAVYSVLTSNKAMVVSVATACAASFGLHLTGAQIAELVSGVVVVATWIDKQ